MNRAIGVLFFAAFFFAPAALSAQENDTTQVQGLERDSIVISPDTTQRLADTIVAPAGRAIQIEQDTLAGPQGPDPIKAALLSAALPGLGQAYNGSYWKIPIVYGGFLSLAAVVQYYDHNYIKYRNALAAANDGDPATENPYANRVRNDRLFLAMESARRNRDYTMILTGVFYLLNIVEAHVDAHLQTFDISDDIALNIKPAVISSPFAYQIGLSLNFLVQ